MNKNVPAIKVLHIIDSGSMYGAEVMLLNLVREQQGMGVLPCIASIGDRHAGEKSIEAKAMQNGIPVKKFRMRPGINLVGTSAILKFARENHFTLLHAHGYKGNIQFGLLPSFCRRLPMVTTVHGYTSMSHWFSKMRLYEWLDAMTLPRIDAVVLVNRGMMLQPIIHQISLHISTPLISDMFD